MTDKERILLALVKKLYFTCSLRIPYDEDLSDYVHFEHVNQDLSNAKIGDLVIGNTGQVHDWSIGFVHEIYDASYMVIREIGSNRICEYGNESFAVIRNLHPSVLLEGPQYRFRQKVIKAVYQDYNWHYFDKVEFHNGNEAIIWIREKFGGLKDRKGQRSVPYLVPIHWNSKTTIKSIRERLLEFDCGKREFGAVDKEDDWRVENK